MPSAESEPEKYSIDEMMERLKNKTSSESESESGGERVTRADGTEAIKIRKRKRRSEQPQKEILKQSRRARIFQVIAATSLIILALLASGIAIAYANSPPFRESLLKKISASTGATPEIGTFRMNPRTANAGKLELVWPKGNLLDKLLTTRINADIAPSSFFGKAMTGEEVTVSDTTLTLKLPTLNEPLSVAAPSDGPLPISFHRYRTPKFSLNFSNNRSIFLTKSEASFYPNPVTKRLQFSLNGGSLNLPGWPKIELDRAFMEFRGKEIDVVSLSLMDPSGRDGIFEFSGTISPYEMERPSTLTAEFRNFPIAGILGPDFESLLIGNIDSVSSTQSNFYTFYPKAEADQKLTLSFRKNLGSVFEISKFPFLFALSQTLQDEWFKNPLFLGEDATATIVRENGATTIENIDFQNKGRMALRGRITLTKEKTLSGELEVGIAESMILAADNFPRLRTLFGPSQEAYRWLPIRISGTVQNPKDDFKDQLIASPVPKPQETPESEFKGSTFEELTKPR